MSKIHAMIDIETLDTLPTSVVLSVGACKFDPCSDSEPYDKQHWKIDIDQQTGLGRTISESTLEWWSKNDPKVIEETFTDTGRVKCEQFAKELNKWLVGADKIWCQGPQFDMVIIENLFKMSDSHCNWQFWKIMDCRTLFNLMPADPRKSINFDAHNALEDAVVQSICVQKAYSHFNINA